MALLVAYDGSENVTECISKAFCRVERYGFKPESAWQLRNLRHTDGQTRWEVWHNGELWSELSMQLAGEHNALNATAAAALAFGQGITQDAIRTALAEFQERQAAPRSARRDPRHHHHRRLRASPHGDQRKLFAHCVLSIPMRGSGRYLSRAPNTLRRKVLENDLVESLRIADRASSSPASINSSAFPTRSVCTPKRLSMR